MAIDKLNSFRNINYEYKTDDDVFIGRGLQLNIINDKLSAVIDEVNADLSYTFGSGLTATVGVDFVDVVLGGALDGDVVFTGSGTHDFYIGSSGDRVGNVVTYGNSFNSNNIGGFVLIASATGAPPHKMIQVNVIGGMNIVDSVDTEGFGYAADYSVNGIANRGNRWIPDYGAVKAYADSVVSPMVYPGAGIALSSGAAWSASITNNSANWNTAFGWGDHSGLYDLLGAASAAVSSHESTYDHLHYNTAYSHSQTFSGNPHSVTANDVLPSQGGHGGEFLTTDGSNVSWAAGGGGSGTVTSVSSSTTNQLTVANPTTTPALTIVTAAVANAETALATGDQIYDFVIGLGYSTTVGTVTSVSGTGTVDGLTLSGTVTSTGNLTLGGNISVTSVTGTLPVANGGTGRATLTNNYVLVGDGTSDVALSSAFQFNGSTLAVTGAITATGEITAYSSDRRLKTNIVRIPDPLEKVAQLDGVTYDWNMDVCNKVGFKPARRHETGMIAQNLGSVINDAITFAPFDRNRRGFSKSGKDYLTVKLEKVIPLLVEAVKELTERNEELVERVRELENN